MKLTLSKACANATTTSTAADTDAVIQCYCTDSYMTEMAQCYDCLAPLVAQAGTDPTFVSDAQEAINGTPSPPHLQDRRI